MFNKHISLKSVPVFSPFLLEIIQTASYLRHFLYDVHYTHPLSLILVLYDPFVLSHSVVSDSVQPHGL